MPFCPVAPRPSGHGLSWVEAAARSLGSQHLPFTVVVLCWVGLWARAGLESHLELVGQRHPLFLAWVWVALRVAVPARCGRVPWGSGEGHSGACESLGAADRERAQG